MRILYLINHAGKAGTEKYVYNIVKKFHSDKAECFFAFNESGLLYEQMDDMGVPCFQLEMKTPFDLSAAKKIARICKAHKIDIIHTHYPRENCIAILSRLFYPKVKVVYTCHLVINAGKVWKIMNKLFTPHNAKVIAVCNSAKEVLCKNGVNRKRIQVIFNGVVQKEKRDEKNLSVRKEFGIDDDAFLMLTLTRYHYLKGVPFLIDSIAEFDKMYKDKYALLIAGDGDSFDEAKEKIKAYGLCQKIIQIGYRSDTDALFCASDVYINSSSSEAMSFAILEAMSQSLPLVVTKVGGNTDMVNDKTNCGFAVEYGNTKGFAEALLTLAEDKSAYKSMAENAKKAADEIFNIEKVLDETFCLYESVCPEKE